MWETETTRDEGYAPLSDRCAESARGRISSSLRPSVRASATAAGAHHTNKQNLKSDQGLRALLSLSGEERGSSETHLRATERYRDACARRPCGSSSRSRSRPRGRTTERRASPSPMFGTRWKRRHRRVGIHEKNVECVCISLTHLGHVLEQRHCIYALLATIICLCQQKSEIATHDQCLRESCCACF